MSLLLLLRGDQSLIGASRRLLEENQPGAAVVVAQAAVETAVEQSIGLALKGKVEKQLGEWITDKSQRGLSWSPTNGKVRNLWTALTGDPLSNHAWWATYSNLLTLRNAFAHSGISPTHEDAAAFIDAAEEAVTHVREFTKA